MSRREWTDEEKKFISEVRATGIRFVRSMDQLTQYSSGAKGLQMSLDEVLDIFGIEVVQEFLGEGSALIVRDFTEPGRTFRARREYLKLDIDAVANAAGVSTFDVLSAEHHYRNSINVLIKIANALGLNPKYISWKAGKPELGYLYPED